MLVELARAAMAGRTTGGHSAAEILEAVPATREAGAALVARASAQTPEDRRIDHIVFTGSTEVGRGIAGVLATSLTPSTLELSGRDSAIVLGDADARLAAESIWSAVRLNAGQTCMGPRRAIVVEPVYAAFVEALEPLVAQTPGLSLVDGSEASRAWAGVPAALASGARSIAVQAAAPVGRAMRAMALADCPAGSAVVRGEHFGPVLAIVRVADEREALRVHGGVEQKLATALFTADVGRARREIAATLGSGVVTINDCVIPTGHPAVGLGGSGESGWGVSRGAEGLLAMTRAVYVTTTSRRVRMPTRMLEGRAARRFMRTVSTLLR